MGLTLRRKIAPPLICWLSLSSCPLMAGDADSLRVLFIGNSYTYTNDMPSMFAALARAAGRSAQVDLSAQGGYLLIQHTNYAPTLAKISQGNWDYVILQEHSQVPTIDYYRRNDMWPAALLLGKMIRTNKARVGLFMTWGHKLGGLQCVSTYCSPQFRDFFQMQDTLASAYSSLGVADSAEVVPVGRAWALAYARVPAVDLWETDNSHPTLLGSYLTACVFYARLYKANPVGNPFTGGLDAPTAMFLQQIASQFIPKASDTGEIRSEDLQTTRLFQNYPNPFNPKTRIDFSLEREGHASLRVFDLLGREIATLVDEERPPGKYEVEFDGTHLSSGVYFYQLKSGTGRETKTFILEK